MHNAETVCEKSLFAKVSLGKRLSSHNKIVPVNLTRLCMRLLLIFSLFLFSAPSVWAEIRIAVAGPFSGAYAAFGEQLWRGASLAAEAINEFGGIDGEPIVLLPVDDACKPELALSVAEQLVADDELNAVLGHLCSSSSIAAAEIYQRASVLMLSPGSTNPKLTEQNFNNVVRLCGRDDQQGIVAAEYILNVLGSRHIAVLHGDGSYGLGLATALDNSLRVQGVEPLLFSYWPNEGADYASLSQRLQQLDIDTVYFAGLHEAAGSLLQQIKLHDFRGNFVAGDAIVADKFIESSGGSRYLNNVYMTLSSDARTVPAAQRVVSIFRAQGYEPKGYTLAAYAGIEVIAAALRARGQRNGVVLADWIKNRPIPTVLGIQQFDAKGDLVVPNYQMYSWDENGNYFPAR